MWPVRWPLAAVQIGQFAQDLHTQYADSQPWFLLATGALTGVSAASCRKSATPPRWNNCVRSRACMLGEMQTVFLISHNNRTGMFDYRMYDPVPCARPLQVLKISGSR